MYGLNIHLQSFHLNNIVNDNDKIRVSLTTIPEESKQAFIIEAKKMNSVHHFFTVNINKYTEKIIFVFRKKSFLQNDPIIASTIIHANEFPKSKEDPNSSVIREINLYEPLANIHDRKNQMRGANRKIIGQMEIQISFDDVFPTLSCNNKSQSNKTMNNNGYSKINSLNNNENQFHNNNDIMFIDNGL